MRWKVVGPIASIAPIAPIAPMAAIAPIVFEALVGGDDWSGGLVGRRPHPSTPEYRRFVFW